MGRCELLGQKSEREGDNASAVSIGPVWAPSCGLGAYATGPLLCRLKGLVF